jgi:hypothetical protein
MPRTISDAQPARARAKAAFAAVLAAAALALSACESSGLGSIGDWFGGERSGKSESPAATRTGTTDPGAGSTESSGEAGTETVDTPSGEPGHVVEIISSDEAPAGKPASPGEAANATAQQPESLAAIPPEPAINDDPEQLIGMGPASLNAFLGAPQLIRREAPASLWQYRAEGCVLDVVLYPDRMGDKVTYLEAREDGATKIPARDCLNKLLRARFDGSSG